MQVLIFNRFENMTMNDSEKMIEIWREWERLLGDIGKDLAVCSAMYEFSEWKVKNLNLHNVMGSALVMHPIASDCKPNRKVTYCFNCGTNVRNQQYCHGCGRKLDWNSLKHYP